MTYKITLVMRRSLLRWRIGAITAMGIAVSLSSASRAVAVPLSLDAALSAMHAPSSPISPPRLDIHSDFVTAEYVAASNDFYAHYGNPDQYTVFGATATERDILDDGVNLPDFNLHILVDHSGNLISGVTGADLTITGAVDTDNDHVFDHGETFGTLVTAEVLKFGYQDTNAPYKHFKLTFQVTGGSAFPLNSTIGVELGMGTSFPGTFSSNFSDSSGQGVTDTFALPVPEPSSFVLALCGLCSLPLALRIARYRVRP